MARRVCIALVELCLLVFRRVHITLHLIAVVLCVYAASGGVHQGQGATQGCNRQGEGDDDQDQFAATRIHICNKGSPNCSV
jgi:hypothetical protein